jgi:hypothetical protein
LGALFKGLTLIFQISGADYPKADFQGFGRAYFYKEQEDKLYYNESIFQLGCEVCQAPSTHG